MCSHHHPIVFIPLIPLFLVQLSSLPKRLCRPVLTSKSLPPFKSVLHLASSSLKYPPLPPHLRCNLPFGPPFLTCFPFCRTTPRRIFSPPKPSTMAARTYSPPKSSDSPAAVASMRYHDPCNSHHIESLTCFRCSLMSTLVALPPLERRDPRNRTGSA